MATRYQHITAELTSAIADQVGELYWSSGSGDSGCDDDGLGGIPPPA